MDVTVAHPSSIRISGWLVEQSRALGRRVIDRCTFGFSPLPSQSSRSAGTDAQRAVSFRQIRGSAPEANALGYGARQFQTCALPWCITRLAPFCRRHDRSRFQARAGPPPRHRVQLALHDNQHADQPLSISCCAAATTTPHGQAKIHAYNPSAAAVMCRYTLSCWFWDGTCHDCVFTTRCSRCL